MVKIYPFEYECTHLENLPNFGRVLHIFDTSTQLTTLESSAVENFEHFFIIVVCDKICIEKSSGCDLFEGEPVLLASTS